MYKQRHITAVIPALNEVQSITKVVTDLYQLSTNTTRVIDEIIVCDNGSTDNTAKAAANAGAHVVIERQRGYGYACLHALAAIKNTDIVIFIDADDCFFTEQAMKLLESIETGADMVIGSRTLGHADPDALTYPQHFGNRLATYLIRCLWGHRYTDLGPFRAITWEALKRLHMQDTHYGWTVEMQVKAVQQQLCITEVAVDTRKRIGVSKISGTISGTVKAGIGIIGMIVRLYWIQRGNNRKFEGTRAHH